MYTKWNNKIAIFFGHEVGFQPHNINNVNNQIKWPLRWRMHQPKNDSLESTCYEEHEQNQPCSLQAQVPYNNLGTIDLYGDTYSNV